MKVKTFKIIIKLFAKKLYYKLPVLTYDLLSIPVAWYLAYWLRFNMGSTQLQAISNSTYPFLIVMGSQLAVYFSLRLYLGVWKFSSVSDVVKIIKSTFLAIAIAIPILYFFQYLTVIPRSILPLYYILLTAILCGGRLVVRWYKQSSGHTVDCERVLIVGAGQAGEGLVRDLLRNVPIRYNPVGFVDDKNNKQGMSIHGVPVLGKIRDITAIAAQKNIDLIFIAVPSARSANMRRIVEYCEKAHVPVRTLPSLHDLASGKIDTNALRDISIEDLLGRDQVNLEWDKISHLIHNKKVLITGGGGSIGSELSRLVAKLSPQKLCIIDNAEFNLYSIENELSATHPQLDLVISLNSVADDKTMKKVFESFKPDIVFHAAAYKHVPMLEHQLAVAVKNNILGTQIVAQHAAANGAEQFILISTDKAVNPTNIMGTTKRAAEIYCQNYNLQVKTNFITVRFGNVLGSTGSVVPLFKKQLAQGGPLTVTHPEISRYFMSINEACQLILQAATLGKGSEIFVLDMGEPIKISYLAEQMIILAGKEPGIDIAIKYTGLRPGEKLYEELFHPSEQLVTTEHEKILKAKYRKVDWYYLSNIIANLHQACFDNDDVNALTFLKELVPEYNVRNEDVGNSVKEAIAC